jgi:fumarate reductase subunit C
MRNLLRDRYRWMREYTFARYAVPTIVQLLRIHWKQALGMTALYKVFEYSNVLLRYFGLLLVFITICLGAGMETATREMAECLTRHLRKLR